MCNSNFQSFSSEESHLEELVSHILLAISLFFLLLTLLAILPNKLGSISLLIYFHLLNVRTEMMQKYGFPSMHFTVTNFYKFLQKKSEGETDTSKPDVNPSSHTLHRVFLPDGLLRRSRRGYRTKCSMFRGKITKSLTACHASQENANIKRLILLPQN